MSILNRKISVAVILLLCSVTVIAWNISLATCTTTLPPSDGLPKQIWYTAFTTSEPTAYWDLTDPEPTILDAINNIEVCQWCWENETVFLEQVIQHGDVWTIRYNGNYYDIGATYNYDKCLPKIYIIHIPDMSPISQFMRHVAEHTISGLGMAGTWIAFGLVVWKKKL